MNTVRSEFVMYKNGTVEQTLSDIISRLENIESKMSAISDSRYLNPEINSSGIAHKGVVDMSVISKNEIALAGKSIEYNINKMQDTVILDYDLTEALSDLPEGASVTKTLVNINGANEKGKSSILSNSREKAQSVSISSRAFPVVMDVKVSVGTDTGEYELSRSVSIGLDESGMASKELDVVDKTNRTQSIVTLGDVADQLMMRVKKIENRLNSK